VKIIFTLIFICLAGFSFYFSRARFRRFKKKGTYWSIGYQSSSDPFKWDPANATIYSPDQLPIDATSLADPFLFKHKDTLYLFHEIVLKSVAGGKIGVSVYDTDSRKWIFQAIVLDEPFHLSYPYIFTHDSEIYMIPESKASESVRLYRATDFPLKWELEEIIIKDKKYVDPTICFWQNRFYLFVTRKRRLYLYHSESLTKGWQLHAKSPLKFWNHGRCGGRIFEHDNNLYRLAQEQAKGYGMGVHCYQICELSQTKFKEIYVGNKRILKPFGDGWAKKGMHHIDILKINDNNYFAVFDGRGTNT
jgi:hypothetical protein